MSYDNDFDDYLSDLVEPPDDYSDIFCGVDCTSAEPCDLCAEQREAERGFNERDESPDPQWFYV